MQKALSPQMQFLAKNIYSLSRIIKFNTAFSSRFIYKIISTAYQKFILSKV